MPPQEKAWRVCAYERKKVIGQSYVRSSLLQRIYRSQQPRKSQPVSRFCQSRAPGGTWLLTTRVWQGGKSRARKRAGSQAVVMAGSVQLQGAFSPGTTLQGAGGLEGEVSGTLWREGSRYMATSRSLGTKWAAALVFLTRFPFITRPSLSRPRYQARPERRWR